jgi:hypothetical protein
MAEKTFEVLRAELDGTEYLTPADIKDPIALIDLARGRKKLPTAQEVLSAASRKYKGIARQKAEDAARSLVRRAATSILGERIGGRAYEIYERNAFRRSPSFDPEIYGIVNKAVRKYISGQSDLEFVPVEWGKLKYKGKDGKEKDVFGYQNGVKVYYVTDAEKALGTNYRRIFKRSGLSEKEFHEAFQEYIKVHEAAEAAVQWEMITGENPELDDNTHGMVQAYVLKSLKESGAKNEYKVAALVDSLRLDAFGYYIKTHADPVIKFDLDTFSKDLANPQAFSGKYATA